MNIEKTKVTKVAIGKDDLEKAVIEYLAKHNVEIPKELKHIHMEWPDSKCGEDTCYITLIEEDK